MQSINPSEIKVALVRLSILFAAILICVGARASETESAAPASEAATAPKDGARPDNSDFAEYNKLNNKMSSLKVKVEEADKKLKDLIAKKKMGMTAIKDEKGNSEPILEIIVRVHKELLEQQEKHNSNLTEITYRFPSKGQEIKRQYHPFRPKSIDQVEKELGLAGQLSDLRNKVLEKYRDLNAPEEAEPLPQSQGGRSPASIEKSKPERLTLKK